MNSRPSDPPWVVVCGGVHFRGGMDKANAHLVRRLAEQGRTIELVAHDVDAELASLPSVHVHHVSRPFGSFTLGAGRLDRSGRAVAARMLGADPRTRVLVNGAGCAWPGLNWVHCVHAKWDTCDTGAPVAFRWRNRWTKWWSRIIERRALQRAELLIANSERTRTDLIEAVGIPAKRIHVVRLGTDADATVTTPAERMERRRSLCLSDDQPVVAFVGALGHDANKGFDTLYRAWTELSRDPGWAARLLVIGDGSARAGWERRIGAETWADRVRFLGHVPDVPKLLQAADLLVAPSRYEAYGLTVREALARGVPVLVSRTAGVAEHLDGHPEATLDDPSDVAELVARLRAWLTDRERYRAGIEELSKALRRHTWTDMADQIIALAEASIETEPQAVYGDDRRPSVPLATHSEVSP